MDKPLTRYPRHPKHPERVCWGCSRLCPANDLACGNGKERTEHLSELFGDDWYDWPLQNGTAAPADQAPGSLLRLAAKEHERLDSLLRGASAGPDTIDGHAYAQFRSGLLRHIAMEEQLVIPTARRLQNEVSPAFAKQLRADHAALVALLVPTPTPEIVRLIATILEQHNPLEEGPGGLYEECERLVGADLDDLLARIEALPEVPAAAYVDGPRVQQQIAELTRARGLAAR